MEKRDYIKEAYDNCLKDAILLVSSSGFGGRGSSTNSLIITKNNELYNYRRMNIHSVKNIETASISKSVEFKEEHMKKIIEFISKEVIPKDKVMNRVFDASYKISGKIGDKYFSVVNDIELTQKLRELIDDIADKTIKGNMTV